MVYLDVHGHYPTHGMQVPFFYLTFRAADSPYTRRDMHMRGFLHYHVPVPSRPLSGGLRFRCTHTPSLAGFAEGFDLLTLSGLPWTIPLASLVRRNGIPVLQSLLRDNLVSFPEVTACHAAFHNKPAPALPVVHAVGQPWPLDLSAPTVLLVPGPNSLLRCEVYPAVARYGSALATLEPTHNPRHPHELAIRVLELRSNVAFLPEFGHLPPLTPGSLLPHAHQRSQSRPGAEVKTWRWNYDSHSSRMAGALYALIHGPSPVPSSPKADSTDKYPTHGQRYVLERWFYDALPSREEFESYEDGNLNDNGNLRRG
ncbi:hypothetical protein C8F04DRAFT_1260689 [Mycena alexandri]|uniref:Uncharacterized protein n=1 Tax=Mycena alexandri TaxID=1745969 RepID=A0AAD6SVY8_9AGAR|nr:hypothetical protein C8F04DRAFT_1260689 [Mycena alexandri]